MDKTTCWLHLITKTLLGSNREPLSLMTERYLLGGSHISKLIMESPARVSRLIVRQEGGTAVLPFRDKGALVAFLLAHKDQLITEMGSLRYDLIWRRVTASRPHTGHWQLTIQDPDALAYSEREVLRHAMHRTPA